MLVALGNGEELRHLNRQEDWLKTAVVFGNELLSTTICRWHVQLILTISMPNH